MKNNINIQETLQKLRSRVSKAASTFSEWMHAGEQDEDWYDPSWIIESCFIQLLSIAETLELSNLREIIYKEYLKAKRNKNGFKQFGSSPDGEPKSLILSRIRIFLSAIEALFPDISKDTITKDLYELIRDMHYIIADEAVFHRKPDNERDVHLRIEAILKCVFPDLKHKPILSKQIKNFEPDTGIQSIQTLLEYKYLSKKQDISRIADEILADTRGYESEKYNRFLYVIYETNRFRKENEWNQLLREAGVAPNTRVIVLSGEPSGSANKKTRLTEKRKKGN